jgi:uncharacterized membrane protein
MRPTPRQDAPPRTLTSSRLPHARPGALAVALLLAAACGGGDDTPTPDSLALPAVTAPTDSLAALPALPGETSTLPRGAANASGEFRLAGNEPFWAIRVNAAGLTYTTPDYQQGIAFPAVAPEVSGTTLRWVAITAPPEAHTLDVTLEERPCQDTMADKTWTHTARVIFDGTRLTGCGERP